MKLLATELALASALSLLLAPPTAAQCEVDRWVASDAAFADSFGAAVAADGDRALVGSPRDDNSGTNDGSVYVFERSAGSWNEVVRLTASDGQAFDEFGRAVDLDGDIAVCAAPFHGAGAGAVYVFELVAGTWTEVAKLTASDAAAGDYFGYALAIRGERIAIGAPSPGAGGSTGAVYVFERLAGAWTERAKLVVPGGFNAPDFGQSVALQDGRVWGGSPFAYGMGAAHLFEGAGASWSHSAEIMANAPFLEAQFGFALAALGDTLLVGSPGYCSYGCPTGYGYVFEKQAGLWTETQRFRNESDEGDSFGITVDLSSTHAAVGRHGWFLKSLSGSGAIHLYERAPSGLVEVAELKASDGTFGDAFCSTVALAGGDVLGGARFADSPIFNAGAVYAYRFPALASHYCACTSGAPCGNDGTGASGCANSAGPGARISTCGAGSVSTDDLVLTVSGVPASQFGLVYSGTIQALVPFGDGLRCVGHVTRRYPVASTGSGSYEQPAIASLAGFAAGDTRMFQGWFRDPSGPCGSGFNLTDAVEITFVP